MVFGIRAYLISSGIDVADEIKKKRLILSSDQSHLREGTFDSDLMIATLEVAMSSALEDGHAGLWASGDMAWEFGEAKDFSKLLAYEKALETLFSTHPALHGVCQYHVDQLPPDVAKIGVVSHPALYVNETLSMINPRFEPA